MPKYTETAERRRKLLEVARAEWAADPEQVRQGLIAYIKVTSDDLARTAEDYSKVASLARVEANLLLASKNLEITRDKIRALRQAQAEVNGWSE